MASSPSEVAAPLPAVSGRLLSLDALRGFDMVWILGLDQLIPLLCRRLAPGSRFTEIVATQLEHADWEGFRFYDLIFPLFLFLAGVSMAISLPRRMERDGSLRTAVHLVLRCLILYLLGVIYNGGLEHGLEHVRWMGVLQRIALAAAAAGLLSLCLKSRGLIGAAVVLLVGYWALMKYVAVPEFGAGVFKEGQNLANYLDKLWLPGRRYDGDHDPEGLLSTLPAVATAILGLLSGKLLFSSQSNVRKIISLLFLGAALLGAGWAWNPSFPIIKKIWTSSYVLAAGGWSMILLGLFYAVIDVWKRKFWTCPFVWVGANPIALYLASGLGFFGAVAVRLTGPQPDHREWITLLVEFLLMLATARWLYRRGVHIKI